MKLIRLPSMNLLMIALQLFDVVTVVLIQQFVGERLRFFTASFISSVRISASDSAPLREITSTLLISSKVSNKPADPIVHI